MKNKKKGTRRRRNHLGNTGIHKKCPKIHMGNNTENKTEDTDNKTKTRTIRLTMPDKRLQAQK